MQVVGETYARLWGFTAMWTLLYFLAQLLVALPALVTTVDPNGAKTCMSRWLLFLRKVHFFFFVG